MGNDLALIPQFHAVAVNATEMQAAREGIKTWLEAKVASLRDSVDEAHAALDAATRNNWRTSSLENVFRREKHNHLYYGKLLAAVEAGYTIVPDMPVDVFAIRVKRAKPIQPGDYKSSQWSYSNPRIENEKEERLKVGDGRYESPVQRVTTKDSTDKDAAGKTVFTRSVAPVGFADIEFPLAVAHSAVMEATELAMSHKIFDRIGMVANQSGDPIVLGQITFKRGYQTKTASFLIAWYLDVRTL